MSAGKEYSIGRFRGVPFYIDDGERTGGRRVASHQFPLRDSPFTQDMGRRQRGFTLNIVLVGTGARGDSRRYASVEDWCDDLINAFEMKGPARLDHPRYGELSVQADEYRVADDLRVRNVIRLSISFLEPGDQVLQPRVISFALVNEKADALQAAAAAAFADTFITDGQPVSVQVKAADALSAAFAMVSKVKSAAGRIQALSQQAQGMLMQPANLGFTLISSVRMIQGSIFSPASLLKGQMDFLKGVISRRPVTNQATVSGAANVTAAVNEQAIYGAMALAAVAEAARLLSGTVATESGDTIEGVSFDNADQAIAMRDAFLDLVDDLELITDDAVLLPLKAIRAQIVSDMAGRAANLAGIERITLEASTPALVLAQRLYADARRADDIIVRNGIKRPLFVPASQLLEVLNV